MSTDSHKVRFAVVGLGHFAQAAILPAFANAADKATLAALVTGDGKKAEELGKKYEAPSFDYDEFDRLCASGDIDAVYIALPNSQHRDYAERAARAHVHVLCEKPLAYTSADAQAMIDACRENDVQLMTAYRLHFEAGNLQAIEAAHSGRIGEPRLFQSLHTMQVAGDNIRIDRELGGGPLEDIGIYCINAARYLFRDEPIEVAAFAAWGSDERFHEVPESVSAMLRFPGDRIAQFLCGFGQAKASQYRLLGTKGLLEMDPAFTWNDDIKQSITTNDEQAERTFLHRDQVAAELVHFSECVCQEKEPEPSGQEGLIDVRIIEALRTSYAENRTVKLEPLPQDSRPTAAQSIRRGPPQKPETVHVAPPAKS
jgi:predicted dehydrogenase